MGKSLVYDVAPKPENAILVAVVNKGANREIVYDSLAELEDLANTAGALIIDKFVQELERPHPATAIGKGKVEEIKQFVTLNSISLVIFDDDLTPAQVKNLEINLNVKVIDRSGLILDIFVKHAKTLEAKVQVELAQSQYLLPRLTRLWTHLEKQFGGIGTKGPGETQIETDRRILRVKIQHLKDDLKQIAVQKEQQRKGREALPRFALVGYTNAGKSTLMNSLTEADVFVEDKLFATLDTTVRAFELPGGKKALLSDTVGFIKKLPAHLVASFRSTLAEAELADVLIHVVDVSHVFYRQQIETVKDTLKFLKIDSKPTIIVFNKVDKIKDIFGEYSILSEIESNYPGSIFISAKNFSNLTLLLDKINSIYEENKLEYSIIIPFDNMNLLSDIYEVYEISEREDTEDGIKFTLQLQGKDLTNFKNKFNKFIIN